MDRIFGVSLNQWWEKSVRCGAQISLHENRKTRELRGLSTKTIREDFPRRWVEYNLALDHGKLEPAEGEGL